MSRSTVIHVIRICHLCGTHFAGPYGIHIRKSEDHQSTLASREVEQKMARWRANVVSRRIASDLIELGPHRVAFFSLPRGGDTDPMVHPSAAARCRAQPDT